MLFVLDEDGKPSFGRTAYLPATLGEAASMTFYAVDFDDEDVVRALRSFNKILSKRGKVVIMDAVLPNEDGLNGMWNAAVSFDVLLMLTGRRGERSKLEWSNLAEQAGLTLDGVLTTSSVTVDLAVLTKK